MPDADAPPDPKPVRTADRVLDTAAELFRRKGYAQTTTRELAEELGIHKATLYHHIRNKEDLLEALCLESLRRVTVEIQAIPADAPDRLRTVMVRHLEALLRDQNLHAATLNELQALTPDRRERVVAGRRAYQDLIHRVVADEQDAGRLRTDVDARHLTLGLLNQLNWTLFWFDPAGEDTPEVLAGTLADVFLRGAEPR